MQAPSNLPMVPVCVTPSAQIVSSSSIPQNLSRGPRGPPQAEMPHSSSPALPSSPLPPASYAHGDPYGNASQYYHTAQGYAPQQMSSMSYKDLAQYSQALMPSMSRTPATFTGGAHAEDTPAAIPTPEPTIIDGGNSDSDSDHSDGSVERRVMARFRASWKAKGKEKEKAEGKAKGKGKSKALAPEKDESAEDEAGGEAAGGKKGKKKKAKAVWIDAEDAIMTRILKAKAESRAAPDNGFTPGIYREVATECNDEVEEQKGPMKTADMVSTSPYVSDADVPCQRSR